MKFCVLLGLAWAASTATAYSSTKDCTTYLSRQAASGTHIRFSHAFSAWMHNADDAEYIEFQIFLSNGDIRLTRWGEPSAIHVSGHEFSHEEYLHRASLILGLVRGSKLAFRHSEYLGSIHAGVIQLAGNRDAIAALVTQLEREPESLGGLQFAFR